MSVHTSATTARTFVGRTREFAALMEALRAARQGRGNVCLVSGEPGIGKSRLIAELVDQCPQNGFSVHWGLAWEAGGAPAYWPWIQVLRSVLALEQGRAVIARTPRLTPPLSQLVPELVGADTRAPARLDPEQARFQLMEAVSALLQGVAASTPLMVALEDLHAADPDSLALLEFVARQLRISQALLVATYRDAEISHVRVGGVIARIKREATALSLSRLDRDAVREYIRTATHARPLEQTVTELHALTEGHPLYLAEVVELGVARGSFYAAPTTLKTTILERTGELPGETRSLLAVASVLGRDFSLAELAELAELPIDTVEERLAPAAASRVIEPITSGWMRFEHVLVREALHDSLPLKARRTLHEERARHLENLATSGGELRWSELAHHLEECGPAARLRAVEAWRLAAAQADGRHAFDDASLCYARALNQLGHERMIPSAERARLMLELAVAQIRAGDLEAGQRNAQEAFAVGETLRDANLMADAALAYGNVFTYARVDPTLVRLLRCASDALGDEPSSRKARVLARLASAMQPAADPEEPMQLAREAIRMARTSDDPRTLLVTLRSAVSALMDLGDPAERLALNREHVALAQSLGDLSESMRGHMRMVIDAIDLGDAGIMDHAIEQCDAIARQLVLPHYQWTAAAFRTMRATIRGDFAEAESALAEAEHLAERTEDENAGRTLIVQRLALADVRDRHAEMTRLGSQVERAFANVALADVLVVPELLAIQARTRRIGPDSPSVTAEYLERLLAFKDMATLCCLGEFLATVRDRTLAERLYENLSSHCTRCGHWGLMGIRWVGPVARVLALLASALDRHDEAEGHFSEALHIARRMRARPWIARICIEWAEALIARGDRTSSSRAAALLDEAEDLAKVLDIVGHLQRVERGRAQIAAVTASAVESPPGPVAANAGGASGVPVIDYFSLKKEGEVWLCECEGQLFRLRDSRGMQWLARLVAEPHREHHVLDLVTRGIADAGIDKGDAGEMLDDRARREYRTRLEALRAEIEEATSLDDTVRAEQARAEIEQLSAELTQAFGLSGRARRAGSAAERARVNVQRRIKDAIQRIAAVCPSAGRHLEWAVHTGTFCSYRPS